MMVIDVRNLSHATVLEIYRNFKNVDKITHTHSVNAVAFAQTDLDMPTLGTPMRTTFYSEIPCIRMLSKGEVRCDYELITGKEIIKTYKSRRIDPMAMPSCVVQNHRPFIWGERCKTFFLPCGSNGKGG